MMCINRLSVIFSLKFKWEKQYQAINLAILTASGIVGLAIGGFTSGALMTKGRKQCMLIATAVGVTGIMIEMVDSYPVILVGRVIYGFSCGLYSPCIGRYIEETVPMHLVSALFPIYTCGITAASIIVMGASMMLPKKDDPNLLTSNAWRYFLAVPVIMYSITFFGIAFFIRTDTPKYYLSNGKEEMALRAVK
jgi:SP family facilitated glucose transporter-like MFS transporter 1